MGEAPVDPCLSATMSNCILTLSEGMCAEAPGPTFLFISMNTICIQAAIAFVVNNWRVHVDRFKAMVKKPNDIKSGIFLLYMLFVGGNVAHWSLGNYLNAIRVASSEGYFSYWALPHMFAICCFFSVICLLSARLTEIARTSMKQLMTRQAHLSIAERALAICSIASPIIATIFMIKNSGGIFKIWASYTTQLQIMLVLAFGLLATGEYAVRAFEFEETGNTCIFRESLNRIRLMVSVITVHVVFNIIQNQLNLFLFPMVVWKIFELGELLAIQRSVLLVDKKSGDSARKSGGAGNSALGSTRSPGVPPSKKKAIPVQQDNE